MMDRLWTLRRAGVDILTAPLAECLAAVEREPVVGLWTLVMTGVRR